MSKTLRIVLIVGLAVVVVIGAVVFWTPAIRELYVNAFRQVGIGS